MSRFFLIRIATIRSRLGARHSAFQYRTTIPAEWMRILALLWAVLLSLAAQVTSEAGLTYGKTRGCSLWVRPAPSLHKQDCATSWMPSRCCRVRRDTGWANNFNVFAPGDQHQTIKRSDIAVIHEYHLPPPSPLRDQFGGTIKTAMARRLPLKAEDHLSWRLSVCEYDGRINTGAMGREMGTALARS